MRFCAPVASAPLLFAAVVAGCVAAPVAAQLLGGERHLHFLVYALLQGAAWGWTACCLAGRRRWLRGVLAALFFAALPVELMHYALLGHCVDIDSVRLVLDTDTAEAGGFFRQFFGPWQWLAVAAGLAATAGVGIAAARLRLVLRLRLLPAAGLMVAVCCGFAGIGRMLTVLGADSYERLVVWQSQGSDNPELCHLLRIGFSDPVVKAVCIGHTLGVERRNLNAWRNRQQQLAEEPDAVRDTTACTDSLHLVVVIGESFIRSHSSLYGYRLPVNPRLGRELADGALTVMTDAVAPANFTVLSLSNVLNLNSVSRGEKWWESASFAALFGLAGWDVEVFSNQYEPGSGGDLEQLLFDVPGVRSMRRNSRTERYDGPFVAAMTDSFDLARPHSRHTLTLWHLRGQHFPPADRLPADARRRFDASDVPADREWLTPERRAVVADYANATLYNDSVVAAIIDLYRDRRAMLVYFSDHGEEMWDSAPFGNRNRQRPDDAGWMRRQHDVPMVVWLSEPLRRSRPDLARRVAAAAGRAFSLDLIGHGLLGAGGVATPYYRPALDVFSDGYRPVPRVTAQGYRYD